MLNATHTGYADTDIERSIIRGIAWITWSELDEYNEALATLAWVDRTHLCGVR